MPTSCGVEAARTGVVSAHGVVMSVRGGVVGVPCGRRPIGCSARPPLVLWDAMGWRASSGMLVPMPCMPTAMMMCAVNC